MARTRKSHAPGKEDVKTSGPKLKPAYAANGRDPFVVYADLTREGDPYPRVLILKFAAEYAAQHFISQLVHNDSFERVDPVGKRKCIKTSTGVRISMFGDDLERILDYKMSEAEKVWENDLLKQQVLRFKYGTHEAAGKEDDNSQSQDGTDETLSDGGVKRVKSKGKGSRTPKEPKVKIDKSGLISAIEIAGDAKLEGREIRGILRSSGLKKPDVGWMWAKGSDEYKEAKKIIDAGVKALLKKKAKK